MYLLCSCFLLVVVLHYGPWFMSIDVNNIFDWLINIKYNTWKDFNSPFAEIAESIYRYWRLYRRMNDNKNQFNNIIIANSKKAFIQNNLWSLPNRKNNYLLAYCFIYISLVAVNIFLRQYFCSISIRLLITHENINAIDELLKC